MWFQMGIFHLENLSDMQISNPTCCSQIHCLIEQQWSDQKKKICIIIIYELTRFSKKMQLIITSKKYSKLIWSCFMIWTCSFVISQKTREIKAYQACVHSQLLGILFKTKVPQNVAELILDSQKTRNVVIFYKIWGTKI